MISDANDALYWRELDGVLRQTLGVAVLLASASAAALTVTGAAPVDQTLRYAPAVCISCISPHQSANAERTTSQQPDKVQ